MESLIHLHYRYPGTSEAAQSHFSQQPRGSPYRPQDQTHPTDEYMCSDSSCTTHGRSSLDCALAHGLHSLQKATPVRPRGNIHPDLTDSLKMYYMDDSADLSDQYIPSSSDKITCTDHRPLDEIFGNIRPSPGWPHAKSGSKYPSHNGASRGHPRHMSVLTYPLPTKPQLDGVVQIPLLAVDNRMTGTGLVVDFRCSDWGIGVQMEGIPMSDLVQGNVSALEHPHERVLDGTGLTRLRLNILWPHYPPFAKVISAFGTDGQPITRAELGYQASLAFAEFFYQITAQTIIPASPGPYTISSSTGPSSPGIKFDQLHLITVRNTSRGEWMAEIRAVLRHP